MGSPFAGINISASALRSYQSALDVTSHNMANVNTAGYSRQLVSFAALQAVQVGGLSKINLGSGVTIAGVNRVRDQYLQYASNANASAQGQSGTLSAGLTAIDSIYGEPSSTGISNAINQFFTSFSTLASNPSDPGAQTATQSAAQNLATQVSSKYSDLSQLNQSTTTSISNTLTSIQSIANSIANVNTQIASSSPGSQPNDLEDQRDQLESQLASLTNVTVSRDAKTNIDSVSVSGFPLVNGTQAEPFPTSFNSATSSVSANGQTYQITGGQLGGEMALQAQTQTQMSNLDTLANTLRTQINTLSQSGKNAAGQTGIPIFNGSTTSPQTGAIDFDLSAAVKASAAAIPAGSSGKPSDGTLAQTIANVQSNNIPALGNQTFSGYFQANVTALGSAEKYQNNLNSTNKALGTQISNQISSNSGVSLDEETSNMVQYQQAYQANAKMLNVFDQVLQYTINMVQ